MTTTSKLTTIARGEFTAEPCYSSLAGDQDIAELLVLFVGELPQRLTDIRQAAQGQNWQEVRRLAHQLRGAGGSYGFPLLSTAAGQLEAIAHGEFRVAEVREALDQLTAFSERLRA